MFSTAFVDGMVLAATVLEDRGAAASPGLAPGLARALAARLEQLAAMSRERRHTAVRALVRELAWVPPDAALPPRAGALLAADVPREVGRRWAQDGPPVRRGFRASRSLKRTLHRLAATSSCQEEHEAAEPVDEERLATLRALARTLGGDDPERALAALCRGLSEPRDRAPGSRLGAIGRELALVWERPWRE